jgi:hypothetical protein
MKAREVAWLWERSRGRVFDADLDSPTDGRIEGPQGVELSEALAWARSVAPVVIVERVDHQRFSAGRIPDPHFPELPE